MLSIYLDIWVVGLSFIKDLGFDHLAFRFNLVFKVFEDQLIEV